MSATREPISIVGFGCRLPGDISSPEELLAALRNGRDCVGDVPRDRWSQAEYFSDDALAPGKTYTRHGGFVSGIDQFDAGFFGVVPAEADRMDPQQRMLLETVWLALEHAGQSPDELAGSATGVFVGIMNTNDYSSMKWRLEGDEGLSSFDAVGDAVSIAAGRVAHMLGAEGPCFAVDTACSSSLVATHLACQSLLAGECDTAVVAGVNAILLPRVHITFSKLNLLSRAGRCRSFDAEADGYVRSEGCVAVVLRRQSSAVERRDHILADIVGSAVNQDGRTAALTAPNPRAQEGVARRALERAGVDPGEVGYVEAHGTGTPVGDPAELRSLVNVFAQNRTRSDPLLVGSIKSNFGHLEAAAGALGMIKAALSLDREQVFPNLHFTRFRSPDDLEDIPVRVPTATRSWRRGRRTRLAGVNAFGYSGTNAHVILSEAPDVLEPLPDASPPPAELLVVSARSSSTLEALADRWIEFLDGEDASLLGDIVFTAVTGRAHLPHRLAVTGRSRDELARKLRSWREGRRPRGLAAGRVGRRPPRTALVFTGQGAQHAGMARELYEVEPLFRERLDACAAVLDSELAIPLLKVLFGAESADVIDDTRYAQPALFAVEYALAELLLHWGLEPDLLMGHSVGEVVAACVAGAVGVEDALRFVATRARLMGDLPRDGKMVALAASEEQAREWIRGHETSVSIAGVNGPRAVVVSGAADVVEGVARRALEAGCSAKPLAVSHAFHSPLMDPIVDELSRAAETLESAPPRLPIVSNVTGEVMPDGPIPASYWAEHLRRPVRFHAGVQALVKAGCSVAVEVGPHPALTPAVGAAFPESELACVPTLTRDGHHVERLLEAVGRLFARGVPLRLDRRLERLPYRRTRIPTYPFKRERHWLAGEAPVETAPPADSPTDPMLGRRVHDGASSDAFELQLGATTPWVDHRVLGSVLFPGSAYLDMAARALAAVADEDPAPVRLHDVALERPLVLEYGKTRSVRLVLEASDTGPDDLSFSIASDAQGRSVVHCRGVLARAPGDPPQGSVRDLIDAMPSKLEVAPFYAALRIRGLEYGASFATVIELRTGEAGSGQALGRVQVSAPGSRGTDAFMQSALLDGCLHVCAAAAETLDGAPTRGALVLARIASATLRPLPAQVWSHVRVEARAGALAAQLRILDDEGRILADFDGVELRSIDLGDPSGRAPDAATDPPDRERLMAVLRDAPRHERIRALIPWLEAEVKDTLGEVEDLDPDEIEPSTAFIELGVDSLLITELQRRLQEKLQFRFPPMQVPDYESIESLAEYLLEHVLDVDDE